MGVESISAGSSYMFRMTKHYVFLWDGKVFMDKTQKLKAQVPAFCFFPLVLPHLCDLQLTCLLCLSIVTLTK